MKKEWTVKLGLLALILTLVTTSLVSGTFAKYTSFVEASDTARVAKFEFDVEGFKDETINLFDTTDDTGIKGADLIAPGTSGSFNLVVTNKSEVAVKAEFDIDETNGSEGKRVPIFYTLESLQTSPGTQRYSSVITGDNYLPLESDVGNSLESALLINRLDFAANDYNPTEQKTVYWYWAYEEPDDKDRDTSDTALGESTEDIEVILKIICTVTQLDE